MCTLMVLLPLLLSLRTSLLCPHPHLVLGQTRTSFGFENYWKTLKTNTFFSLLSQTVSCSPELEFHVYSASSLSARFCMETPLGLVLQARFEPSDVTLSTLIPCPRRDCPLISRLEVVFLCRNLRLQNLLTKGEIPCFGPGGRQEPFLPLT